MAERAKTSERVLSGGELVLSKKLTDWTDLGEGSWFIVASALTTADEQVEKRLQ